MKAIAAQANITVAIGSGPWLPTQPTAALAATPNADCVAPSSDEAAPARSPNGAIATEVAFEAMKPMLAIIAKIGMKKPAEPKRPLAPQPRRAVAPAASPYTPQPRTRRTPWRATMRRFTCDTVMKLAAPAPKYHPNCSAGTPKYSM